MNLTKEQKIKMYADVVKTTNDYILSFLERLIDDEFLLLNTELNKALVSFTGENPAYFHKLSKGKFVRKFSSPFEFTITSTEKDGFVVHVDDVTVNVPFPLTDEKFKEYSRENFAPVVKKLSEIKRLRDSCIKDKKERDEKEARIRSVHKDGKYTYQWKECAGCEGEGKVNVPNGRYYKSAFYDRDGDPIEEPDYDRVDCSSCNGAGGFIEYSDERGWDNKRKPCSKWNFERNEDDFLRIILE
jgi:hypothetical protein